MITRINCFSMCSLALKASTEILACNTVLARNLWLLTSYLSFVNLTFFICKLMKLGLEDFLYPFQYENLESVWVWVYENLLFFPLLLNFTMLTVDGAIEYWLQKPIKNQFWFLSTWISHKRYLPVHQSIGGQGMLRKFVH